MKFNRQSLRPFATVAAGLLALVACQNATDPNSNSDSPVVATASFPIATPRVPDNVTSLFQKDTISNKLNCPPLGSDTSTTCTATLNLPHPLGMDSLALQLWTLGVQTYTLYFKESGNSTKLDLGSHSVASLDTLLLSGFAKLTDAQRSSFGTGPTGLVAYYASLILDKDTALVGKALPVGMSIDSVKKELVRVGVDSGKTLSQLTSLSIQLGSVTLTLDTATIRLDVSILIHAGVLSSTDSTALYPAYPVQVQTPIAVSGPVVSGGSPVVVSGIFTWKAGKVVSPKFEVHTANGVDTNFTFPITNSPSTSATTWNLSNSVTLLAKSGASAGTDTLVATLSTDSGYFATSRATFQVTARDTTAPTLKILSPSGDTTVPNATAGILVKAAANDSGSGLDSIAIRSAKFASSPCTTTVALAVGVDTITVQAWDNAGNKSTAMVHVTRAKAPGDSIPPFLKITSPSKDTTVSYATTSLAITATATDSGSGMGYVMIASTKLTTAPYTATVSLGVGTDTIVVQALDNVGNKSTATVHVTRAKDTTSPVITPGAGTTTRTVLFDTTKVQLGWTIQDSHGIDSVWLNGVAQAVSKSPSQTANLIVGPNPFVLVVTDSLGNSSRDSFVITRARDTVPPVLVITNPSKDTTVVYGSTSIIISTTASDAESGLKSVFVNTKSVDASGKATVALSAGVNVISAIATDIAGNSDTVRMNVTVGPDLTPPAPVITPGTSGYTTTQLVTISITPTAGATIQDSLSTGNSWVPYNSLLSISSNIKVFARTILNGMNSSITEADFAFPPSLVDTVAKDTGTVAKVTVFAPGSDSIWVTSNNLNWTSLKSGASYSMMASGILKAYAVSGNVLSATDSITVTLYQRPPTIIPNGGMFPKDTMVTLASSINGDTVYYTTDGKTTPSRSSTRYTAPFRIGATGTVQAISVYSGVVNSTVASAKFYISDTTTYGIPWKPGIAYGVIQDSRDSQVYRTVTIGSQTWTAQNMNYAGNGTGVGVCYSGSTDSCVKYGRLYTWLEATGGPSSIQSTCPTGWHVPSDSDWTVLQTSVGEPTEGAQLKSTEGWSDNGGLPGSGTDNFGFRALPGGNGGDSFGNIGSTGYWWSASDVDASSAWFWYTDNGSTVMNPQVGGKTLAFSVRCMKN